MRLKIPFGIAQIGKAFRNEITPGNFIFRSREFEMMEVEYFINPKDDNKWFKKWVDESYKWFVDLGLKKENLRKQEQKKEELAHYSKETIDIEYKFPFDKGFAELMGIANRTDYDLKAHGFSYKDDVSKKEFVPYVIEPSAGVDRAALAFLLDAYEEVKGGRTTTTESTKEEEVVLRLHKDLAPYKVAVLPLSKKEKLSSVAKDIYHKLQKRWMVDYDEISSIGRRYRRQDEIGTPYCVTVDFESLEDKKVTVRDRDTMKQERVLINELVDYLMEKLD
jgi:glycyl-tRNA synthetase